jgi:hypothetical protein
MSKPLAGNAFYKKTIPINRSYNFDSRLAIIFKYTYDSIINLITIQLFYLRKIIKDHYGSKIFQASLATAITSFGGACAFYHRAPRHLLFCCNSEN